MPIPNIATLYQQICKGAEGGHEFARIMNLLLTAEGKEIGSLVKIISDSIGDYKGVDCILEQRLANKDFHAYLGFEFKFFPSNLNNSQKQKIRKSLDKAIENFPEMDNWTLITPEDFNKNDMKWFDELAQEYNCIYSLKDKINLFTSGLPAKEFTIHHIGHTQIVEMALRHPHIGIRYFEELFPAKIDAIELCKVSVDTINTNWSRSGIKSNTFNLRAYHDHIKKSNELVFDFQFKNSTSIIYHLQRIDIKLIDIWSSLKGIPHEMILTSSGEIEYEIDFKARVNSVILDEVIGGPLKFNQQSSIRFGLHLLKFIANCPGNMAKVQFQFVFDDHTISSEIFELDF
jgi:hypothetical protein